MWCKRRFLCKRVTIILFPKGNTETAIGNTLQALNTMCRSTNVSKILKKSFTEFSDVWFTSKRPLGYDVVRMIMFALKDRHSPAITYKAGIGLKITIGNIIGHRHFCIHTGRTTRRGRNSTATGRILYHLSGRSVISQEEDNQPKTQKQEKRIWGRDYAVPLRRVLRSSLAKRKKNKSQLVRNKANREGTDLFH